MIHRKASELLWALRRRVRRLENVWEWDGGLVPGAQRVYLVNGRLVAGWPGWLGWRAHRALRFLKAAILGPEYGLWRRHPPV